MRLFHRLALVAALIVTPFLAAPASAGETEATTPAQTEAPAPTPEEARHDWWSKAMQDERQGCSTAPYTCCCQVTATHNCMTPSDCSQAGGTCEADGGYYCSQ